MTPPTKFSGYATALLCTECIEFHPCTKPSKKISFLFLFAKQLSFPPV